MVKKFEKWGHMEVYGELLRYEKVVHALYESIKFLSQTLQSLSDWSVISVTQGGGNLCLGFAISAHVQDMTVNVMKLIGRKG